MRTITKHTIARPIQKLSRSLGLFSAPSTPPFTAQFHTKTPALHRQQITAKLREFDPKKAEIFLIDEYRHRGFLLFIEVWKLFITACESKCAYTLNQYTDHLKSAFEKYEHNIPDGEIQLENTFASIKGYLDTRKNIPSTLSSDQRYLIDALITLINKLKIKEADCVHLAEKIQF